MPVFKEIVTKAVIGKVKKHFKNVYSLTTEVEPTTILGCWIINHKFKGYEMGDKIIVDGSFDVNIWYSHDEDSKTAVVTKRIEYNEPVKVKTKEETEWGSETEIIVRALKQPNCSQVEVKDGNIEFEVEKELGVELVGDTKVKIAIEVEEEIWEEDKEEQLTKEVLEEIEENINEDYLT